VAEFSLWLEWSVPPALSCLVFAFGCICSDFDGFLSYKCGISVFGRVWLHLPWLNAEYLC
jgi:hypothetical protein